MTGVAVKGLAPVAPFQPAPQLGRETDHIDPCSGCAARPHGVCADLRHSELVRMAGASNMLDVPAGTVLFHEGDTTPHVFSVVCGALKLFRLLPDGRRQITGFLFKGDFCGLGNRGVAGFTAQALTEVSTCRFRRGEFDRLLADLPALEHRLVTMAGDELLAAQEQILLLGRKTARERLASFLIHAAARQRQLGEDDRIVHLPMTRLDIADYLGLTIETVSRTVTQFKTTGLIRLLATDRVALTNPAGLQSLADGHAA